MPRIGQIRSFRLALPHRNRVGIGNAPRAVPAMRLRHTPMRLRDTPVRLCHCGILLCAFCALLAGCTPRDFPENPFERAEQDLTAPSVVPLDTGFPGAAELAEAREAYANAQYYWTWLMRVEGYTREEWEPEVEVARQTYRLLAERADDRGDSASAKTHMEEFFEQMLQVSSSSSVVLGVCR